MIFQDGGGMVSETGAWRVPIVLDNLIQQHAMPVTIAIFIDPGVTPPASPGAQSRFNRSYEYDAVGGRYAYFLTQEILPEVAKLYKLSADSNGRAIAGSGGIAAWERPDAFRRVATFVGSFTNLRAGNRYASLIRKMEPKPVRVFMPDGSNDRSIYSGSRCLANREVAASLEYAGYDAKFVVGTEGHNRKQGAAILPGVLRWLWRDYPQPVRTSPGIPGRRHYIIGIEPLRGRSLHRRLLEQPGSAQARSRHSRNDSADPSPAIAAREPTRLWGYPLLQRNAGEKDRLRQHVRPILFD